MVALGVILIWAWVKKLKAETLENLALFGYPVVTSIR
jgi:hypothetical protein